MKSKRGETYQGSYGKFLETLKTPLEKGAQSDSMNVMRLLAEAGGRMAMKSLLGKVDMPTLQLVKTIESMTDQDLVSVTSSGDDDMVELTATGQTVVRLEAGR